MNRCLPEISYMILHSQRQNNNTTRILINANLAQLQLLYNSDKALHFKLASFPWYLQGKVWNSLYVVM